MKNFKPNDNFVYYLYWICERMNIFWRKKEGEPSPYTNDPILNEYKFTNVYKSLDRATQYEYSNVIYNGKKYSNKDMFFRILVYKHFNNPATWDLLEERFGDITYEIGFDNISDFLLEYIKSNPDFKLYSNAYMLTAAFLVGTKGKYVYLKNKGLKKYQLYFIIFKKEIFENGFIDELLQVKSLEDLYNKLRTVTSFADFLTYQYIIDLNYSEIYDFDENSFAKAGLGTCRGIDRTFDFEGKPNYEAVINWVRENFSELLERYSKELDIPLNFRSLPNRMPTNVDLSNCFCETDKMLRGMGISTEGVKISGSRIKNHFVESKYKIKYVFPPKWGVSIE